jgi:hypothetical protein
MIRMNDIIQIASARKDAAMTTRSMETEGTTKTAATEDEVRILRPKRARVSTEEARKRMEKFAQERKEAFVGAVRKGKD